MYLSKVTALRFNSSKFVSKKWCRRNADFCFTQKNKVLNSTYFLWNGFWSQSHQHRAKIMPRHFLILYTYCSQIPVQQKVPSQNKYLLNLGLVKLFFPEGILYHTFISSCYHYISYRLCRSQQSCLWLSGPTSKRCFSSKTHTHLHWHKLQSSNFCLKG